MHRTPDLHPAGREAIDGEQRPVPAWQRRLLELSESKPDDPQVWELIYAGLAHYVRVHAHRGGALAREDVHDIAAEKLLSLMTRHESRGWAVRFDGPVQLRAFLSTLARNGVIDQRRRRRRAAVEFAPPGPRVTAHEQEQDSAGFASDLRDCVSRLRPQARRVWMLRVFHELPSRQIAAHPAVRSTPAGVDVAFSESRKRIKACMRGKGHDTRTIPAGAFVALWSAFVGRSADAERPGGPDES